MDACCVMYKRGYRAGVGGCFWCESSDLESDLLESRRASRRPSSPLPPRLLPSILPLRWQNGVTFLLRSLLLLLQLLFPSSTAQVWPNPRSMRSPKGDTPRFLGLDAPPLGTRPRPARSSGTGEGTASEGAGAAGAGAGAAEDDPPKLDEGGEGGLGYRASRSARVLRGKEDDTTHPAAESSNAEPAEQTESIVALARADGSCSSRDDPSERCHHGSGSAETGPPGVTSLRRAGRETSCTGRLRPAPACSVGEGRSGSRSRLGHSRPESCSGLATEVVELELLLLAHAVQSGCFDGGCARLSQADRGSRLGRSGKGRGRRRVRDCRGRRSAHAGKLSVGARLVGERVEGGPLSAAREGRRANMVVGLLKLLRIEGGGGRERECGEGSEGSAKRGG